MQTRQALVEQLEPINVRRAGATDDVFTRQLRTEMFGPWPRVRKLLADVGVDPTSATARHVNDGRHGMGNEQGELFEFSGPARPRFRARLRWRYPGEADVNEWQGVDPGPPR